MHWAFAPILGIATQPKWPRVFETFGEDPHLASVMGVANIRGLQGYPAKLCSRFKVAACMKHFVVRPRRSRHTRRHLCADLLLHCPRPVEEPGSRAALRFGGGLTILQDAVATKGDPQRSQTFCVSLQFRLTAELGAALEFLTGLPQPTHRS